jgi:hypothetical protein
MCQEQSWLLHLCDVGLAASWLSTLIGPLAKLATVVAFVVLCRLMVVGGTVVGASTGATLSTSSRPGLAPPRALRGLPRLRPPVAGEDPPSSCHNTVPE